MIDSDFRKIFLYYFHRTWLTFLCYGQHWFPVVNRKMFLVYHVCMLIGPLQCIYKTVTVSQNGFSHIDSSGKLGPAFPIAICCKTAARPNLHVQYIPKDLQITDDLGAGCYQLKSFWLSKTREVCYPACLFKVLYILCWDPLSISLIKYQKPRNHQLPPPSPSFQFIGRYSNSDYRPCTRPSYLGVVFRVYFLSNRSSPFWG